MGDGSTRRSDHKAHNRNWFSRRHETSEVHEASKETWRNRASLRPIQHWDGVLKMWVKEPR